MPPVTLGAPAVWPSSAHRYLPLRPWPPPSRGRRRSRPALEAESLQSTSPRTEPSARPPLAIDPAIAADPRVAGIADSGRDGGFLLSASEGVLDLRPPGDHARPGVRAAFPPDRGGGGPNPLVRAFGPRIRTIHDLTAGLGGDAYRLAHAGYRVHAVERDAVVYALLASGWRAAVESGAVPETVAARLTLASGEAQRRIAAIEGLDVGVYLDPMYPAPRRARAKPRRELQVLRAWLGADEDTPPLVEAARDRAARVVVKRPHHADPLVPDPSHTIESKLVRFDVYVNPARLSERAE